MALAWFSLQAILNSAGNVSKLLWGGYTKRKEQERAERFRLPLRQSLQVTYRSPIRSRQIRNAFEHFDEELEKRGRGEPS